VHTENQAPQRWVSWLLFLGLVCGNIGIDQVTKEVAERDLLVWAHPTEIPEYHGKRIPYQTFASESTDDTPPKWSFSMGLCYVRNQGAAWGALSDLRESIRSPFFYLVTFFAICILLYYLKTTPAHHRAARLGFTLVLSGAIGNFIDRVRLGYVIDFLDVSWSIPLPFFINFSLGPIQIHTDRWAYDFPKFNWADSMITIGVTFLLIDMLILESFRKRRSLQEIPTGDRKKGESHESTTAT